MPLLRSEYSCPRCKKQGVKSQILANMGALFCENDNAHNWNDTMAFYAENPLMEFKVEVPKNLPQQGHSPMTVSLPIGMEQQLGAKYGDKVNVTVASILQQMLEGNILIVGQTDFDRLVGHLGATPTSSGELVGMVYAMKEQVNEQKQIAEEAARDLKAYEGVSIGRVIVDLGEQYTEAVTRSKDASLPLKLWVEEKIKGGIRDNWF